MATRRHLLTGLVLAPVANAVEDFGKAAAKPAGSPDKSTGLARFAPPMTGRELMRERYFPNYTLVSSAGRRVKFYDDLLKDKIVVLSFMYADCRGVCPTIISNLQRVRKILDKNVSKQIYIYSLTLRPEVDTPAKLADVAALHHVEDPNWLFLTGKPDEVDTLRHLLGFADPNPEVDKDKTKHSGMIRYGNESLTIWGSCQGNGEPEWLAQEIQFAVPREFKKNPLVNE